MRIVCISDSHCYEKKILLPKGDILIHSGDLSSKGREHEVRHFIEWFQKVEGFDMKIFIAGNHDLSFENIFSSKPDWLLHLINDENLTQSDCVYLQDSFITYETPEFSKPLKFYGSPWQPRFYDWAFNVDRDKIYKYWELIPEDTDVLITHGPPHGVRDYVRGRVPFENLGCESLRYHIDRVKPILSVFGHIHDGYGTEKINDTLFVNASVCDEGYHPVNQPIVVEVTEVDGKLIANVIE